MVVVEAGSNTMESKHTPPLSWINTIIFLIVCVIMNLRLAEANCGSHRGFKVIPRGEKTEQQNESPFYIDELEEENKEGPEKSKSYGSHQSRKVGGTYVEGETVEVEEQVEADPSAPISRCRRQSGYCMGKNDDCRARIRFFQSCAPHQGYCQCCIGQSIKFEDGDIEIVEKRLSWSGARSDCKRRGGDLAVPKHVSRLIKLLADKSMSKRMLWLGISRNENTNKFLGVHNNIIKSGWQRGEPLIKEGKNCVIVEDHSKKYHGLRTRECHERHFFICDLQGKYKDRHNVRNK